MHDSRLEQQLRSSLRAEGDGVPLTITTAELERRLAARRRAANGRRFSFVAAALAVLAIGSMVAATNGWLNLPAVGVVASPSATPSSGPTALPSPTPEPTVRIRESNPLGSPNEAVLVRPIGDLARPDAFEVTGVDPVASTSRVIGTIPGSVLPDDAVVAPGRWPTVSETGWLALPIERNAGGDPSFPALVVVDLAELSVPAVVFDHVDSASWDQVDELLIANGRSIGFGIPTTGQVIPSEGNTSIVDIVHAPHLGGPLASETEGSRFIATNVVDGKNVWGAVGFDGTFTPTNDLPAVFQRSGIERPAGAGAHTLTRTCDQNGTTPSDCSLVEQDATGKPVRTWMSGDDVAGLFDLAWAVDGKGVWVLIDSGSSADGRIAVLHYLTAPGTGQQRSTDLPAIESLPTILGITLESAPGQADVVAIGDDSGFVSALITADGSILRQDASAWFAGWAGRQAPYDPD